MLPLVFAMTIQPTALQAARSAPLSAMSAEVGPSRPKLELPATALNLPTPSHGLPRVYRCKRCERGVSVRYAERDVRTGRTLHGAQQATKKSCGGELELVGSSTQISSKTRFLMELVQGRQQQLQGA